ncbi:MAG TPA: hypothetical protein DCR44_00310, partial [Acholeplasmatales bacterium]|nr:hypothetical protein [Acholeplasmatales bacterium]
MEPFSRLSPDQIYVSTPADKQELLARAARRNILPAFKAVDVARFAPIPADDILSVVMDIAAVDIHHAAKIAAFCPAARNAAPSTPSIAFLK